MPGRFSILVKAIINRLTFNERITAVIKYSIKRGYPKVQRNALCPCGSGKRFKDCHLDTRQGKHGAKRIPYRVGHNIALIILLAIVIIVFTIYLISTGL